ncbi:MAG: queuosine precursor transporter [Isosphaeraceae bacterium]
MTTPSTTPQRTYRYYDLVMAAFVCVLLCSNFIGAAKQAKVDLPLLGEVTFGAGVLFFPISYLFGDILTEVYGYARSRKVVWAGFGALAFATFMSQIVLAMPAASTWTFKVQDARGVELTLSRQVAWAQVFGGTWRVAIASMIGFFAGEFVNSFTLAKMKILTRGRYLWTRTIGSTIVGEAADSLFFYPIAFLGQWTPAQLVEVMIMNYLLKVGWEVVATPITYLVVGRLKRVEHEDFYDVNTDFTPFSLDT